MTAIYTLDLQHAVFRYFGWLARMLPAGAGSITDGAGPITTDEFYVRTHGKTGVVLIHGYNSDAAGVATSYQMIVDGLKREGVEYDFVLRVLWPGGYTLGFPAAEARVFWDLPGFPSVGTRLHAILEKMTARLDVIAHSLGNGVVLESNLAGDLPIRHLFLTAPAVDDESICVRQRFSLAARAIAGKCVVFYSYGDSVLRLAYRASTWRKALGWCGPAGEVTPNTVSINCTGAVQTHGGYRDWPGYYAEIRKAVAA